MTHFRLSHLKRINPLIILWLQTLFDSQFWVIKYASPLFFHPPIYVLLKMRLCYATRCAVSSKCDWVMCHIISRTYLEDIIPGEDMGAASWNIYLGRVAQRWQRDGMTEWNEVERGENNKEYVCMCVLLCVCLSLISFYKQEAAITLENRVLFLFICLICIENEQSVDDANM